MKVDESIVLQGKHLGVIAVKKEFEALNDAEANECLDYVLHRTAGTVPTLFPNSNYARDCDENGVLESRRGLTLDDFVRHPHSSNAQLTRAHVLVLRL